VQDHLKTKRSREVPFSEAVTKLSEHAGDNADFRQALKLLEEIARASKLDDAPFDTVWTLMETIARAAESR
jgi:uncharacterized protein YigA (DUF484 family)